MKRHWRSILAVVVVAAVAGIGFWIYQTVQSRQQAQSLQTAVVERGTLTASIGATGTIQARQQAALSFSINGQVGSVNVRMGDRVEAGQVLMELDPAYYPQTVLNAQIELVNARKALEDLQTSQTALAQAELTLANAARALDDAQTAYDNAVARYNDGWVRECEKRVEDAHWAWMVYRFSNDGSPAAQRELARLYQEYLDALRELEKARRYAELGVGSTAANSKEAQMELDIAKAELALAQARYNDALAEYNRLKDGVPAEDLAAAEARVAAAQSILDQVRITAPFAGTIMAVELLPGDSVSPGTIGLVIADLSELHVDVPVAEVDYNRLAVGQAAELSLDAIPGTLFSGRVSEIKLHASTSAGSVAYPVTVVIDEPDPRVLPGMTAAVDIEVEHLEDVLLVPNRAVRTVGGSRVVYLYVDGGLKTVEIELGASNDVMSQVVSGDLQEGDLIVLNPPTTFFNGSGPMSGGGGGGGFFGG
ncbi:MAG: efflux RND transporter periplasmic adaptor subunit [Anaerolineales bacterium]|nr:efflux RND transporter periplasmic adaptor subunit [Anaerolineales bacterium]